jgi:hypothetical protein
LSASYRTASGVNMIEQFVYWFPRLVLFGIGMMIGLFAGWIAYMLIVKEEK